jgi:ABC-type transport system substrate-binding protein
VPAYGFIPSSSPYYDPKGQLPQYDPAGAKKLVGELKAKGVTLNLKRICIPGPEASSVFQILNEQAKAVGINSRLTSVEQGVLVSTLLAGKPTGATANWNVACFRAGQISDPDGLYNSLHTGGPSNLVKYSRPSVDKALETGRSLPSIAQRKPYYDKVQEQVAKDVVYIPLLFDYYGNIHQTAVSGLGHPSPRHLGLIPLGGLYYQQ